jgi:hypothetical protein
MISEPRALTQNVFDKLPKAGATISEAGGSVNQIESHNLLYGT